MSNPSLIIMAAGMGSRFGGCKQITPVDAAGHIIIDFSIFDALRAGFGKVVCVIKPDMEADFRAAIGDRTTGYFPGSAGTELRRKSACSFTDSRSSSSTPVISSKRVPPFCQEPWNCFSPSAMLKPKDRPHVW